MDNHRRCVGGGGNWQAGGALMVPTPAR